MSDGSSGSWAGRGRFQQRYWLLHADPRPALPAGGWPMRKWVSPGSSTCWRRACTATATTGARATAPSPLCSRSCRCVPAAGAGPLRGEGLGVPQQWWAGLEQQGLELLGAGPPGRGGANTDLEGEGPAERVGNTETRGIEAGG